MAKQNPASSKRSFPRIVLLSSVLSLGSFSAASAAGGTSSELGNTNSRGIVGTGALGIVGTGDLATTQGRGIVGTGALGIVGTGALGIVGTGALGIVGTGDLATTQGRGIVGTGALGIVGTGDLATTQGRGIVGTGDLATTQGRGIVGTGALGIVGTGDLATTQGRGIVGTGALGIVGTGALGSEDSEAAFFPLVAYGPIEQITDSGYVILGQTVLNAAQDISSHFNVGDTVAAFGLVYEGGIVADKIISSGTTHVDGSSDIFVAGLVTREQSSDGSFRIGELAITIGSAGTNPKSFGIQLGEYVEITGVKIGAQVLAETIYR